MCSIMDSSATSDSDIFATSSDDFFLKGDNSPIHISAGSIFDIGEISIFDAYSFPMFGLLEDLNDADPFLTSPTAASPPVFNAEEKNSFVSSSSETGSSPVLGSFPAMWDIDEDCSISMAAMSSNSEAVAAVERNFKEEEDRILYSEQGQFTTDKSNNNNSDNLGFSFQASEHAQVSEIQVKAEPATEPTLPLISPLDLLGFGSYGLLTMPMNKICRGRRVPTIEMMQRRIIKPITYPGQKLGRDSSAERRFVCVYNDCRKCFKRREHLIRHQRSAHSSEKPFKCPVDGCYVSCNRKDNMHQHMRNAHQCKI